MEARHSFFYDKAFCLVTGASQGFGRQLAIKLARELQDGSMLILIARNMDGLSKTEDLISGLQRDIKVRKISIDLAKIHDLRKDWLSSQVSGVCKFEDFSSATLFHVAGCLGEVSRYLSDGYSSSELQDDMALNVTSCVLLTTSFLAAFKELSTRISVVNISTLAALQPFPSWGSYCITRSAREMAMRILAAEEKDVRVLNYAPGPMITEMTSTAAEKTKDDGVRSFFKSMLADGTGCAEIPKTLDKLILILKKNAFESGCHIDFFDKDD